MNIYFYEYYDPDCEDQDKPITAYFTANTEHEADVQFAQYSNNRMELADSGCCLVEEIEECGLSAKIANFSFAVDDDNLLLALLTTQCVQAGEIVEDLLHSHNMAQSFACVVSQLPKDNISHYLQILIANDSPEYIKILIEHGVKDSSGLALARACMHGKRELFDLIYPVSNPSKALEVEVLRRGEWIEQRMAHEQHIRLHNSIGYSPSASKFRRI